MADWSDEFDGGDELLLTRGTQTKPVAKTLCDRVHAEGVD
jgi:hypothetical protein